MSHEVLEALNQIHIPATKGVKNKDVMLVVDTDKLDSPNGWANFLITLNNHIQDLKDNKIRTITLLRKEHING